MEAATQHQIQAATDALWVRAWDKTERQVAAIEEAVMALLEQRLDEETRANAQREAHKIAGGAGMFGFHRASAVARELELLFEARPADVASATRAAAMVEDLHAALTTRGDADVAVASGRSDGVAAEQITLPGKHRRVTPDVPEGDAELATVLLFGFAETCVAGAETAFRNRGLGPRSAGAPGPGGLEIAAATPVAAAVVVVPAGDPTSAFELIRTMDSRSVAVVAVLPEGAGTTTRLAAVRAGASLLLEVQQSPAGLAQVADAVATMLAGRHRSVSRILAVDDDETVLDVLREQLMASLAAEVTTLADPHGFWPELNRVRPDLLLIDIDMPGVSGVELCRLVRSDPTWRHLPVVFMSGRSDPATVQQVYAAGADDFVGKPVVGPELNARIANRLERTRLLRLLAETDPLTGLANRRRLESDLERLERFTERHASSLSLAVVDLDRFKRINDRYGHAAGDEVLRRLAAHLQSAFRGEDVVARVGGEEFVVAMLGMRRQDAVERLTTVLDAFASTALEIEGHRLRVGASAGVAQHEVDGTGFEELFRAADAALRVAKDSGRGRVLPAGVSAVELAEAVDVAIVEDDEILAELLRHTLTTQGYTCLVLPDGVEAVERLADRRRPLRASVVLLDIDLPGRNGFEVLQALRQAEVTSRSAVLVVSARSSEDEALQALRLGATDHVSKPFSVPVLMQKLHPLLSGAR